MSDTPTRFNRRLTPKLSGVSASERPMQRLVRWRLVLEEFSKLFDRETSIADNTTHRERVDGIMAGNRKKPHTVRHDDMLALARNAKTRLLQGPDRLQMIDAGEFWHA
jgi:hypothetical protein